MDIPTIIGYVLFAVSEILSVLPIPANSFLNVLASGLKKGLITQGKPGDIEMAKNLLDTKDNLAKILNDIGTDQKLTESIQTLLDNKHILPQIKTITDNPQLQYMLALLNNNKFAIHEAKNAIEGIVNKYNNLQQQQIQLQQPQLDEVLST